MKKYESIGLSLKVETVQEVDKQRGDVGRSLYLRKIIDKGLAVAAAGAPTTTK
jgi:hypothetical protein